MLWLIMLIFSIICFIVAFLCKEDAYTLGIFSSFAVSSLTWLVKSITQLKRYFILPILLSYTRYYNEKIRVSISYLFSIPIDGKYLLIKGNRIKHQFQPVGGVYKVYFDEDELYSKLHAETDKRFPVDEISHNDLRIYIKGRYLRNLINWFDSGVDREVFPFREFYEELIRPGILDAEIFQLVDFNFKTRKTTGIYWDEYSNCPGIIISDIYELQLNGTQKKALSNLTKDLSRDIVSNPIILLATVEEIVHRGARSQINSEYDIAPTATWLIQ